VNNRGQFSIIAALLVAVVLIATVITTYSAIRYSAIQDQPQVLSAIDETNLALKQVLGFTVGYYGSVLRVTGNSSYAKTLASNYLTSGLENIGDIRPEWGSSFNVTTLDLSANWFTNTSYSAGHLVVKYDLSGLGIYGISYSASCRLDVQVLESPSSSEACLSIFKDENEPLINLGKQYFKFYRYRYSNLTWEFVSPSGELTAFTNGTYLIDIPSGIDPSSYVVQVEDTRGIMVAASSFSRLTSTLMWNTTSPQGGDYVDINTTNVDSSPNKGIQSNFTAQQFGPDNITDTLTEGTFGTATQNFYPDYWQGLGSTTLASGTVADLQSDNGAYMRFHSYVSSSSSTSKTNAFIAYRTGTSSIAKERTWTGDSATWSTEGNMPSSGDEIRLVRVAYCPVEGRSFEKIVITMSPDDNLDAFVWNGITWSVTNDIVDVGSDANYYRCFDIAYEKATGRALFVYSRGATSNEIGYRTWTAGSGWSSESQLNLPTSGIVYWIALSTAPGTRSGTGDDNEIAMIYMDANADVYGYVWTGSSWSNMGQSSVWDSSAAIATEECITVAYEQQSGRAMFIWGDATSTDNYYNIWNGASLSSNTNLDIPAQGGLTNWVTLKADPSSNALLYLAVDAGSDLNTAYWSGSAWTVHSEHDESVDTHAQRCADFAWEPTGSKGLLVWGTTSGQINWKSFTAPNSWPNSGNPSMSNSHRWVQLRTNPRSISGDVTILGAVLDSDSSPNLGAIKWDGSAFAVIGSNTISSDTGTTTYECFELEFMNYGTPTEFTSEVEFTGTANTQNWIQLTWALDSSASTSDVSVTYQLYNYQTGQYSTSGDGYMADTVGTSDSTKTQTITANLTDFRDGAGNWKLKFKAVKSTSTQFDMNIDLARYSPEVPNYALDIEEQWTNVDYTNPRQDLCIKTGTLGSENLMVDVWQGGAWHTLTSLVNGWNNVSVTLYIDSPTFTIRFRGSNDGSDTVQDSWNIDAVLLRPQPDLGFLLSLQDSTTIIELLQNGTMRWLGQNLQLTTQEKPIPPVPVKAIHVNQTINGVNQEVPFQIEDWASEYRIPLGLTNNATVFSSRQMIVFLTNVTVSKVTIWWNGSDMASQTPLAYTNRYFSCNPSARTLNNGRLTLQFAASGFVVTSTVGSATSTARLMRLNMEEDNTDPELAYVIINGTVRDIVQGEAEWGTSGSGIGGADNCSNVYANIVLTLPAKTTYYTYQLRLMFINSTQPRNITDLCPIKLTTSISQLQTENGTVNGIPVVTNGTGSFYNYDFSGGNWTAHHWSQFISGTQGAGIMFTDAAHQQLYAFDSTAGSPTGALKANNSSKTIELLPVALKSVQFTYALDITWHGAVATFDSTATPIYTMQGTAPTGLWILVEYQPTITVTSES
jgi:hypothetical protein